MWAPYKKGIVDMSTPAELREKWAQELESGDYEQGECVLKSSDHKYCCLGVAAEAVLDKEFQYDSIDGRYYYYLNEEGDRLVAFLSQSDADALGIGGNITEDQVEAIQKVSGFDFVTDRSLQSLFTSLNDSILEHTSFSDIAKVVRALND